MSEETPRHNHFIRQIVAEDRSSGKVDRVVTRFPPEPNGYLHLGHAKSICLNFGLAGDFGGVCHLRFDDTNPSKEDIEYVEAIKNDVHWLGFDWDELRHASDYFGVLYACAEKLIRDGKAFVCDLSAEQQREYRGTLTEPGRNSPFRDRSVEENLDLFAHMRAGEFDDGAKTLRAKIDMSSGNINLRDPTLYRIRKVTHQNTGDAWPIYPMYDFAHSLSDAIEGITHSLCTLEFEDHRPLYDWCVHNVDLKQNPELMSTHDIPGDHQPVSAPQQIEFARGNLDYNVMSKRKLIGLVQENLVDGWDDPRMPTISGTRRRGYPPAAIRNFWDRAGVTKQNSTIEYSVLENAVREELDASAPRRLAVIDPLKLIIGNLPDDHEETLNFPNHPKNEALGTRAVPFSRELWIERDDFMEVPPKGFHRLVVGGEVRLRGVGIVKCQKVEKDPNGTILHVVCTLDTDTRHGMPGADRKVKGTIHWVSAKHATASEIRLYERLFNVPNPDGDSDGRTYADHLNPDSKRIVTGYVEPSLNSAAPESNWQFERLGYFVADRHDHSTAKPVFNRTVTLRDSWAKAR
ncbi:MAG: glutamine--tRNA ligase/YqeY domain fusion protein [Rudaea sp.]